MLAFGITWLVFHGETARSPVVDNIEQLTWVRQLAWGYYKHPPLPTLLLWPFVQVFGLNAWVTYVLGAVMTLGSIALLWGFLQRHRGAAVAHVAALAALCITFSSGSLAHFNHNTVLLPFNVLAALLAFRALGDRRTSSFLLLGAAIGLGALCKYQIAVTVFSLLAYVSLRQGWQDPKVLRGLVWAGLCAALVFTPHGLWLLANDFAPIRYASESSLGASLPLVQRAGRAAHWMAEQLISRMLPAFILLAVVAWPLRRAAMSAEPATAVRPPRRTTARDATRDLLVCWSVVPLVFMPLMSLATGSALQMHWGTPFLIFVVPAVMEMMSPSRWERASMARTLCAFLVLQCVTLAASAVALMRDDLASSTPWRRFDSPAVAAAIAAPARRAMGGPIHVISGSAAVTGAIALQLPERPFVLIDGNVRVSTWVPKDLASRCGVLEIVPSETAREAVAIGPAAPGLAWRVVPRDAAAPPCPAA